MTASEDMSTPVTRGELREDLARLEVRFDHKLEMWGGALLARIESSEKRTLAVLAMTIESLEKRLLVELARHVTAFQEAVSTQIAVVDEKYAELPARVGRLEAGASARKKR
jgi:hypothetical protein